MIAQMRQQNMMRIFRESFRVIFWTAIVSSIGGVALEGVQGTLLVVLPLLILLPPLNDAIGSIGTVTSARFTSTLYMKGYAEDFWSTPAVKRLFREVSTTALVISLYIGTLASIIALVKGAPVTLLTAGKVLFVAVACTLLLMTVIFGVAIFGGLHVYRNGNDPDNVLIPVTTSVADIGNMLLFSLFVFLLF